MKILGRELPSIGEYLAKKNEKEQAQAELILMLAPFLAGYSVFLYQWIVQWKTIEASVALPSVITCAGYILYFKWRDNARAEAQALNAVVLNIRWDEEYKTAFKGVIASNRTLNAKELFDAAANDTAARALVEGLEELEKDEPDKYKPLNLEGDFKVSDKIFVGTFYERIDCLNWIYSPRDGRKSKSAVLIMDFPFDKTFRKTPGHWFSHKGQIFPIVAGDVDATFVGWEDDGELVFYFRVTSSQERTRLIQIGLGLQPATSSVEEVNRAKRLDSTRKAISLQLEKNRAEGLLAVLTENYPDAEKDSYRGAFRIVRDMDKVREIIESLKWRGRISLRNVLLVVFLAVVAWYVYKRFILEPEEIAAVALSLATSARIFQVAVLARLWGV